MAYPVEGDGVLSFLRRWNRIGDTYVEGFMELNAGRLNAKGGLELGMVSLIPKLHPGDEYPPETSRTNSTVSVSSQATTARLWPIGWRKCFSKTIRNL